MSMIRRTAAAATALALTACSGMDPKDFAGQEPKLVLEDYFQGETRAWGIFEDRLGNLRRQFMVDIDGRWDGRTLVLDERFLYSDGETERRVWTIAKQPDGSYVGTADDVIGEARGTTGGNVLNWRYEMNLKVGDGTWRVGFDDWMFLQPDDVLINRAYVSRWGIEIGSVTIVFNKPKGRG